MNKRLISFLCVLAVVLVFAMTAQSVSQSWNVGAEDNTASSSSTTKKGNDEEEYVPTTASTSSSTSTTQSTTESTTKKQDDPTTKTEPSTTKTPDPTSSTTDKPPTSETEPTSPHTSEKDSTKAPTSGTSTTTKKGANPTTTRYTTTKPYVPHMTVPQVDNTTVEGTTLNPLDAYFERISGDSNMFTTVEAETVTEPEELPAEHKQLSTIAIVAICLGAIALVTVALTAGFAVRNRRAADAQDAAPDYETDAYGEAQYEAPQQPQNVRAQVDESDTFTVVSLDDKDYKD